MGGFEPRTFRFESDNTNHCATEAAWRDGVMNSARDFDLLGESVPQVRVSARTLALR